MISSIYDRFAENPHSIVVGRVASCVCAGYWFFFPMTRFRIGDFGLSEIFGVLAVLLVCIDGRFRFKGALTAVLLFHLVLIAFTVMRFFDNGSGVNGSLRDVVAVSYSLASALAIVNLMAVGERNLASSVMAMQAIVSFSFLLLISGATGFEGVNVWFLAPGDEVGDLDILGNGFSLVPRYVGLATNPNQLAFFLVFVLFFQFAVAATFPDRHGRLRLWFATTAGVLLVAATRSDAAFFSISLGLVLFAYRKTAGLGSRLALLVRYATICAGVYSSAALWALGVGNDGGNGRFDLWLQAMRAVDGAKGLGLGYGMHIEGIDGQPVETHSVLFDLLLFGGVFGGLALTALLFFYAKLYLTVKNWDVVLTPLVILGFSLTYSPLRNPIFWVALFIPFLFSYMRARNVFLVRLLDRRLGCKPAAAAL